MRIPDTTLHNGENIAETPVRLTGTFGALRYAQQRIGLTIAEIELKESKEYEGKHTKSLFVAYLHVLGRIFS